MRHLITLVENAEIAAAEQALKDAEEAYQDARHNYIETGELLGISRNESDAEEAMHAKDDAADRVEAAKERLASLRRSSLAENSRKLVQHVVTPDMIDGPLYHGTAYTALSEVLETDRLKGSRDRTGLTGVSCTTSLDRAENYARGSDRAARSLLFSDEDMDHLLRTGYEGPVIVLKGKLLVSELETRAVKWRATHPPEERVVGDIHPLSRYLEHILVDRQSMLHFAAALEKKATWEQERYPSRRVWRKRSDDFKKLLGSPLLKDR